MYPKLDERVIDLLCCPLCKGDLVRNKSGFACRQCSGQYKKISLPAKGTTISIYDFRLQWPEYCFPDGWRRWGRVQTGYERRKGAAAPDEFTRYLREIDSVREIYTQEFILAGRILDIGGNNGRLRHFLTDKTSLYISVDPFIEVFQHHPNKPNMLKAYPMLAEPCNFLACFAEYLPFKSASFDWAHMRSVIDHLHDPYLALNEAYRVLDREGKLLVGLTVQAERAPLARARSSDSHSKPPTSGLMHQAKSGFVQIRKRIFNMVHPDKQVDDHMNAWTFDNLVDLIHYTGFAIEKAHWQKPPYSNTVYILATKR